MTEQTANKNLNEIKIDKVLIPLWKFGIFAGHCVIGFAGIGYFTYKVFINKHENVYDKQSQRFRFKSPLFKNLAKTVGWTASFFLMTGVLVHYLKPTELLFEEALRGEQKHYRNLKVDPLFQDYYIFQTMEYFGISEKLIKKTQTEFKQIKRKMQESGQIMEDQKLSIDKQIIKIALSNQNAMSKVLSTMNQSYSKRKNAEKTV